MTRELRYRIQRKPHGKRRALSVEHATLDAVKEWARRSLMENAEVVEVEMLPLGCEAVSRVGVVTVDGKITWRRERARPRTKKYLSDELVK